MEIIEILRHSPLNGLALLVSLAVIIWSLFMIRRVGSRNDRTLTGLIGLTSVFQGLRLLVGEGIFFQTSRAEVDGIVNLFVMAIYVAALWLLKRLSSQYLAMRFALRLAEGNQASTVFRNVSKARNNDLTAGLFDAVPMPMFAVGLDGHVSGWNRAAEKALGWSRDEVMGQKLPDMVLEPHANEGPLDSDGAAPARMRLRRKNGEAVQSEVRSVPLRDAKGTVNGILTIVQA